MIRYCTREAGVRGLSAQSSTCAAKRLSSYCR
ncbi:hypothetical protein ACNKHT_02560 [Shigella flexneri]